MKFIYIIIISFFSITSFGQTQKESKRALKEITFLHQLDSLKKAHPNWMITQTTYSPDDSKTLNYDTNGLREIKNASQTITEKLLQKDSILEFRVSYIFLNGRKISKNKIDSLREIIKNKFNNNVPFSELAKEYSEDNSAKKGGDLGWFPSGRMVAPFETAIKAHKKGDLFFAEYVEGSREWYFVILKTHEDRKSEIITVGQIQNKKN